MNLHSFARARAKQVLATLITFRKCLYFICGARLNQIRPNDSKATISDLDRTPPAHAAIFRGNVPSDGASTLTEDVLRPSRVGRREVLPYTEDTLT